MNTQAIRRLLLEPPLSVTAALQVLAHLHHLRAILLNSATGFAVTLPKASGSGLHLRFLVGTTITSGSTTIKVNNTTDVMNGLVIQSQDGGDTVQAFEAAATDDTITLDGSTRGGIIGDRFELIDMKSGFWQVTGWLAGTGTEATPFSATV